jgi:hypothetical protein
VIRSATPADKESIVGLARKQMERYPLRPDKEKINELVTLAISSARNFAWVVDIGGIVQGVLIGLTSDNLWAQRQNCNIVIWVSEVPGYGDQLLRKFKSWVEDRRAIKVSGMCPDLEVDPRALKLAERIGFKRHGGAYLLYN